MFEKVKNFKKLQTLLANNYCSWFNYSIIQRLREQFLFDLPEKDKSLVEYTKQYNQYTKRRCFLHLEDVDSHPKEVQTVEVICKIDNVDFETVTDVEIDGIKLAFIECLQMMDLSQYHLTLKHVEDGCIILVIRAPACLRCITALTPLQVTQLRTNKYKFVRVQIGDTMLLSEVMLFFSHVYNLWIR